MRESGAPWIDEHGIPLPRKFLAVSGERTFQYDDGLPSLPVPPLQETLSKYLQSVKPQVTEEEFRRTKKTVDEYSQGIGRQLQLRLLEKAKHQRNWNDLIDVAAMQYDGFGKKFIRQHRIHPDSFVHMAVQHAYHKLYHRPAPTYATATTRKFYHGRTETLRSCTLEFVEWSKSMMDASATDSKRFQLLQTAINVHLKNMNEAKDGRGCDRHLLGLQLIATESNLPTPELFLDPSWTKSGGGGNFILSTSFVGFEPVIGRVTPMCKDGYGVFYSIQDDKITGTVVSWTADVETSSVKMWNAFADSLTRMKRLVEANSSATSRL